MRPYLRAPATPSTGRVQTKQDKTLAPAGSKLRKRPRPPFLKSERVQEALAAMPGWRMLPGEEAITTHNGSLRWCHPVM